MLVIAGKPPGHALAPDGRGACSVLEVRLGRAPTKRRSKVSLQKFASEVPCVWYTKVDARQSAPCLQVELPSWGRLDRVCAWREFAEGVPQLLEQVIAFDAQAGGAGVCIVFQASLSNSLLLLLL